MVFYLKLYKFVLWEEKKVITETIQKTTPKKREEVKEKKVWLLMYLMTLKLDGIKLKSLVGKLLDVNKVKN